MFKTKPYKWVAFFSHTGNEIYNLSKALGRYPDAIVTNNTPNDKNINKKLLNCSSKITWMNDRPKANEYNSVIDDVGRECIVTLHGWMRIIPKSVCKQYRVYNLHPGLITKYPELKGADPQKKVFESINTYKDVGCVIHEVTDELDSGKVLFERSTFNHYSGESTLTHALHDMAKDMWIDFLNDYIDVPG